MIAILERLDMDAGSGLATPTATSGQQETVLETAALVDELRDELGQSSDPRDGIVYFGTAETKHRRRWRLRWPVTNAGIRKAIDEHYTAYLAAPVPFEWVFPQTTTVINVQYAGPPTISRIGRQASSAVVELEEVFLTD